jgi:hypothetical protein
MFCIKCGTQLPDDAKFCYSCGTAIPQGGGGASGATASSASAPPSAPPLAPAGVQELKCPACGAPIHPTFGETVVTCDYCGSSVTLGGSGWKEISKHSMLPLKVPDAEAALKVVHGYVDSGLFHRKDFEESTITSQKLTMVPYWVLPVAASTNYQYQDVAVGIGSTVATMAGSALLANALGGGRGNTIIPIMAGPVVNPTRQETITGNYEFPVVAVKAMADYQPKNYQFTLGERTFFDRKQVPEGTPVLNGDLSEDAARNSARALVTQLQSDMAHHKHHMVSNFRTQVDVSEGELMHAPLWEFVLEHKKETRRILIDGHSARVMM